MHAKTPASARGIAFYHMSPWPGGAYACCCYSCLMEPLSDPPPPPPPFPRHPPLPTPSLASRSHRAERSRGLTTSSGGPQRWWRNAGASRGQTCGRSMQWRGREGGGGGLKGLWKEGKVGARTPANQRNCQPLFPSGTNLSAPPLSFPHFSASQKDPNTRCTTFPPHIAASSPLSSLPLLPPSPPPKPENLGKQTVLTRLRDAPGPAPAASATR